MEISHLLVFRVNQQTQATKLVASWVSGTHILSTHSSMQLINNKLYGICKQAGAEN
jgi:hypothetical protein